jgi:ABC-type uncharacterized transport system permease subunit
VAVPLAFTTYFPARALLETASGWWGFPALGVGGAFLTVTLRLWSYGVRHYRSSGS